MSATRGGRPSCSTKKSAARRSCETSPGASCGYESVGRLCDAKTGRERAALRGHGRDVWALAFSTDGQTLASGGLDRTIILWDLHRALETTENPQLDTLRGHEDAVTSLA